MRGHNKPVSREPEPVAQSVSEHDHHHSDADLIYTICQRLIPVIEPFTTEVGLRDATECMEGALARYGPKNGDMNVLLSKMYAILKVADE